MQVVKFLALLLCLLYGQNSFAMYCNDAARNTPLYAGSYVEKVTGATDRMYLYYKPDANATGSNLDPFNLTFGISRQLKYWGCDCCAHCGTLWDFTVRSTFSPNDFSYNSTASSVKVANGGSPATCLRRIVPGGDCPEGGTNQDTWSKVCGYVVISQFGGCTNQVNAWGFNWRLARFGCVHEPLKAPPPPFNKVSVSLLSPSVVPMPVTDLINQTGSTFASPKVILTDGRAPNPHNITLTYDFSRGAQQICQSFDPSLNIQGVFCADVSDNDPSQVCVCRQGSCSRDPSPEFLGCVDRPTPRQSNLKMVAFYAPYTDGSPTVTVRFLSSNANGDLCIGSSSSPASFCDQGSKTIIRHTPDPAYVSPVISTSFADPSYKHTYSQNIKHFNQAQMLTLGGLPYNLRYLREYYRNTNSSDFPFVKDAIKMEFDINLYRAAYNLGFEPTIPALTNSVLFIQNPVNTNPPQTTCSSPELVPPSAVAASDLYNTVIPYERYSLDRNRYLSLDSSGNINDPCNPFYANFYGNCTPPALPVPYAAANAYTINRAFCPGVFTMTDVQHQICINPVFDSWQALTDELHTNYHDLCVPLPTTHNRSDPATPGCQSEQATASNSYVNWPFMNLNSTLTGTCDDNYDLEPQQLYTLTPGLLTQANYCTALCASDQACIQSCNTNPTNAYSPYVSNFNAVNAIFTARTELALGQNRNLFPSEIRLLQAQFDTLKTSCMDPPACRSVKTASTPLHTVTSTPVVVSKSCASDGSTTRQGGCVFKAGCNANTQSERFLGYMVWGTPTIDVTRGSARTMLAAATPDNLGLRSLALPQFSTSCTGSSTSTSVANTFRLCNAYFDSANQLQGKAWNDVDLSQPGALSCIGRNPT